MKMTLHEEKWEFEVAKKGDQIRVHMKSFYHHGIYISDDEVIQFGAGNPAEFVSAENVTVHATTLKEFLSGGTLEVRRYSLSERLKKRSVEEIVTYARNAVGRGGYDILRNNCEHFSNECVFNNPYSSQIEKLKSKKSNLLY